MEEFKLQEDDEDQIDLLNDARGLADLKNALFMSMLTFYNSNRYTI